METTDALETLRADIQRVETTLTGEVRRVETTLGTEIQRVKTTLSADIQRVETTLDAKIQRVETALTAEVQRVEATLSDLATEVHELRGETRRHADVIVESLRDDIRIVAEGVVSLSAKVDALTR